MEYSVCTTSILMSVLECIVSIEINTFILISSRSNHLISNARAYMDQKSINDRALFSELIRGFETYSNLLIMIISRWVNVCWPTKHKFSISEYHDRNRLFSLGLYFKSLYVSCHRSDAFVLSHAYLMVRWRWGGRDVNSRKVYVKMQQTNIPPFCFTS